MSAKVDCADGTPSSKPRKLSNVFLTPFSSKSYSFFEYEIFKCSDFNFTLTQSFKILLTIFFVTRGSLATLWWLQPAAPFYLAFFLGVMSVISGYIAMFSRPAIRPHIQGIAPLQMFHVWATDLVESRHCHIADSAHMLCVTAAFAMYMLGRTMVGRCPDDASMWDKQSCNPSADIHSVPQDLYVVTMFIPAVSQLMFKGAHRWTIIMSWIICAVFFNVSHVLAGASIDSYAWINIQLAVLVGFSYELERGLLSTFLANKERDKVNDERIEAIEQLEINKRAMMEAEAVKKRAMVRHIGHEIRNPLNTIQGLLEVLQIELKPFRHMIQEDIFEIIATCRESCGLGKEIVSDLFAFEHIAAGKYTLELSHTSILDYVYEAIRPFIVAARAKRINVTLKKVNCLSTTMVNIDLMKMGQVMRNLLSNAVKFSKKGGEVVVTVTEEATTVTVAVTDQGPGLTPVQIDCLFEEGVQFEPNKNQHGGGSGLGLYIAAGIVHLHEGCSVWAASPGLGQGSTFFVKFPVAEAPPSVDQVTDIPLQMSSVTQTTSWVPAVSKMANHVENMNILVADDSPTNRKLLVRLMKLSNNRCFEAANGVEAFAMVKRSLIARDAKHDAPSPRLPEAYDVILMDNNMPQMSGIEATRELRKVGFVGTIIGISGDTNDTEFLRAGADAVLTKPVSGAAVAKAVEDALRRRIRVALEGDVFGSSRKLPAEIFFARSFCWNDEHLVRTSPTRQLGTRSLGIGSGSGSSKVAPEPQLSVSHSHRLAPSRVNSSAAPEIAYRPNRTPMRSSSVHITPAYSFRRIGDRGSEIVDLPKRDSLRAGNARLRPGSVTERFLAARDSTAFVTDETVMLKWEDVVSYTLNFIPAAFQTAEMQWAYAEYNRSNLNHKFVVILIGPVAAAFIATRGSFYSLWHLNPAFIMAFVSWVIVCLCCVVVWANRTAVISLRYNIAFMQRFHEPAAKFYRSSYRGLFDNAVVIFSALCTSLYVLARVLQGPCPPGTTLWNAQACNPEGLEGEVPQDALLISIITLIAVQIYIGCASRVSIVVSWVILLVLMNVSMSIVGSSLFFWNNAVLVIAMCVSYETERRQRVNFVKKYLLVSAKDKAMEIRSNHLKRERDAAALSAEEMHVTISGAGHDMKSPITGLVLAVESVVTTLQRDLARHGLPAMQQAVRTCVDAYGTIMHLTMIVNRSVDYCKIRADLNLMPTLQPVHLADCIQQVIGCYSSDTDLPVTLKDIPTDVPQEGLTDASWLQDNLLCIVGNACKYSERSRVRAKGGIIVSVRRVMVAGRKLVEFAVKDCGATLEPAALQAFFMRPVTFRRESVGGMGLGMCCLAARVDALGGTYGARARLDHVPGTSVWFRIPFDPCQEGQNAPRSVLCLEAPAVVEAKVCVRGPSVTDKPLHGLSILVVDDAPSIVKMVVRQLINAGAKVESAKDGREGLEVFKAAEGRHFDIVITDIQMPILDGWGVSKDIREWDSATGHKTVVVGMSAKGGWDMKEKAEEVGMDGFLLKPFRLNELIECIMAPLVENERV